MVDLRVEVAKGSLVLLAERATPIRRVPVGLEYPVGRSICGQSRVDAEGEGCGRGQSDDRASELCVYHKWHSWHAPCQPARAPKPSDRLGSFSRRRILMASNCPPNRQGGACVTEGAASARGSAPGLP